MQSPADWSNLGTLLAGYRKAGIRLQADHWGKMVRMAGKTGNISAIIECAKQADKTGFSLSKREAAVRTLVYINERMIQSGQQYANAPQALRMVEVVLDMLQRPEHARAAKRTRERLPFSRIIRGMMLFTRCAAFKVKQAAGENVDRDLLLLQDEVALFRSLWDPLPDNLTQLREFAELNTTLERSTGRKIRRALNGFCYMQALAQGIRGIALAQETLGDEAKDLARVQEALEKHAQAFVQTAPGRCQGWLDEYEDVTGKRLELPTGGPEQENSV